MQRVAVVVNTLLKSQADAAAAMQFYRDRRQERIARTTVSPHAMTPKRDFDMKRRGRVNNFRAMDAGQ